MPKEKFICYSCKGITEFEKGKRGSAVVEFLLWTLYQKTIKKNDKNL